MYHAKDEAGLLTGIIVWCIYSAWPNSIDSSNVTVHIKLYRVLQPTTNHTADLWTKMTRVGRACSPV